MKECKKKTDHLAHVHHHPRMRRKTQADAPRTTARATSPAHRNASLASSAHARAVRPSPSRRHSQQLSQHLGCRLASSSVVSCCCVVEVGMGIEVGIGVIDLVELELGVGVVAVVVDVGVAAPKSLSSMLAVGVTGVVVVVADIVEEERKERSPAPTPAPAAAHGSVVPSGRRASVELYDRRSPASTTGRLELER